MSFIGWPSPTPLFPAIPTQGYPVKKTPIFAAVEHKTVSGHIYQMARQIYPNWLFELQFGDDSWLREQTQNITPYSRNIPYTELEAISQLFLKCYGSYGEFYFDDPEDNSRVGQIIAQGSGTAVSFLVIRNWGLGLSRWEPVGGVNLGATINVYLNGGLQSSANYAVTNDFSGSHVTFSSPPVGLITMDFSFYYRCRFKDDSQQYDQFMYNLFQLGKCEFQTVKP